MILLALTWWALVTKAEPVCAKRATTLHKAANAKSPVSWKVPRYMPFLRVETKNGWSKLKDLDGETHFARAPDVTNSMHCLVVKAQVANLHKAPSAGAPAADLKTVDRFTPFLRVNDGEEFYQVKDEAGRTAWISKNQVWKPVMINSFSF